MSTKNDRNPFIAGLLVVAACYAATVGGMIVYARGLPFVFDNNETFSSLWHAHNLYRFGLGESCGLADESASPHAAAHPYVHTHQGNVPRLFAFAAYALGARSAEAQIAVTAFTLGIGSILLAYAFFARIGTPLLAVIACLLLTTDYVMFAQWQVVTYRVWHALLFFLTLHCMHGFESGRRRLWAALTTLNFACLFYFELVFALFVSLTACLYAIWLYRRRRTELARAFGCSLLGAGLACTLLLVQLSAYAGVDAVAHDLWLTLHARNGNREISQQAREFYQSHRIIFWENYVDGAAYRSVNSFMTSLFTFGLGPYSPLLSAIVMTLAGGALFARLARRLAVLPRQTLVDFASGHCGTAPRRIRQFLESRWLTFSLAVALWPCASLCCWSLLQHHPWLDLSESGSPPGLRVAIAAVVAGLVMCVSAGRIAGAHRRSSRFMPWRPALACLWLLLLALLIRKLDKWSAPALLPLWAELSRIWCLSLVGRLLILTAATFSVARILRPASAAELHGCQRLIDATLLAFGAIYWISAGYLHSGYLHRWAPFLVFLTNPIMAVCAYGICLDLRRSLRRWWQLRRRRVAHLLALHRRPFPALDRAAEAATSGMSATLLLSAAAFWIHLQVSYVGLMPPDQFAVYHLLRDTPFQGKSFIVSTYAAPTAWATGEWAYYDPRFSLAGDRSRQDGEGARDMETYLWFADRETNHDYARPDYFLRLANQDLYSAAQRLSQPSRRAEASPASATEWSSAATLADDQLQARTVSRDPTRRDRWTIVELDWNQLPRYAPTGSDDSDSASRSGFRRSGQSVEAEFTVRRRGATSRSETAGHATQMETQR